MRTGPITLPGERGGKIGGVGVEEEEEEEWLAEVVAAEEDAAAAEVAAVLAVAVAVAAAPAPAAPTPAPVAVEASAGAFGFTYSSGGDNRVAEYSHGLPSSRNGVTTERKKDAVASRSPLTSTHVQYDASCTVQARRTERWLARTWR